MRIESVKEDIKFETESVNKVISEIRRTALFFTSIAKVTMEEQSKVFGEKTAYEFMKSAKNAVGGGFFYESYRFEPQTKLAGCYAFINQETNEIELEDFEFTKDYDYQKSVWYTEIADILKNPYEVVWTRPYVDDSGTFAFMVTASVGLFDENQKLIALSTVDWKIDKIIETLTKLKPTEKSFVILSAPEKDLIISNTLAGKDDATALSELSWNIYDDSFKLDGVNYMTFRRIMDNGWMLSVQIPVKEIFADLENYTRIFSIIAVISAVLMLFCLHLLISSLVNKPIERLISDVVEVGGGNLNKHIEIKSNDEIGILAAAFNKMVVNLKASMEQAVRERVERERVGAELTVAAQSERERVGAELNSAAEILTNMLPTVSPLSLEHSDFDIYAFTRPAEGVGGDFYDFFFIDSNTIAVFIAEVSGKGVQFAAFMMIAKTLIKNNAQFGRSPKEVFDIVNNLFCDNSDAAIFVTTFMGYLDVNSGKFTFVNAGHNAPILQSGGKCEYLKAPNDYVLGGVKDMSYTQNEIVLRARDELLFYTDGVNKAANDEEQPFGDERLLSTVTDNINLQPKELTETVIAEIDKFIDGAEQIYDATMLVLRYKWENG